MFNWFKKNENKSYDNKDYHRGQKIEKQVQKGENKIQGNEKQVQNKRLNKRSFIGARFSGVNKFNTTFEKINGELRQDLIALTLRARALAKNSSVVASYLNLFIKNVIGSGFRLNSTIYNEDGNSDLVANRIIEDHWYDYTRSYHNYVSADEQMNQVEFDKHLLWNLLVDGQAFVMMVKDPKGKYGIRFALIDALDVDVFYNFEALETDGYRISMGIKVDRWGKPLSYFIRKNPSLDYYMQGQRIEVPASDIIHIYQKKFAGQTRGFTPLAPALLDLNNLDEYRRSQVSASILNANWFGVWESQNGSADAFEQFDEEEIDKNGDVPVELESNVIRYAPKNYRLNAISSNHPNSNLDQFQKSILKSISASLGVSYNHLVSDYQSVNYSSLRQANLDDEATYKEMQEMLIFNWKEHQYAEWLKYLLLSDLTILPYSKIEKFSSHDFKGVSMPYIDPAKQFKAIEMRLALGLASPIDIMHEMGVDPIDTANSIKKWQEILKDRGIKLNNNPYIEDAETPEEDNPDEDNA